MRLGVLGWPVAHSRSPAMHNAALAALGLDDWRYQRLPVPPELFAETVRALARPGFAGANVTIPHKEAALALADERDATAARAIGAANTLTLRATARSRPTTPTRRACSRRSASPSPARRALVLGAGGSARAAVWALLRRGRGEVSVWNRTRRARRGARAPSSAARAVARAEPADLLVNCTSVGLGETAPDGPVRGPLEPLASDVYALNQLGLTFDQVGEYSNVVDLVYRQDHTAACRRRAHGARTLDGLEVLVAQGALSLERWTGRPAPVDVMRAAARGRRRRRARRSGEPAPIPSDAHASPTRRHAIWRPT